MIRNQGIACIDVDVRTACTKTGITDAIAVAVVLTGNVHFQVIPARFGCLHCDGEGAVFPHADVEGVEADAPVHIVIGADVHTVTCHMVFIPMRRIKAPVSIIGKPRLHLLISRMLGVGHGAVIILTHTTHIIAA